jgi:hypothetical protein
MADNSEFGQLFGAAVQQYISGMSSEDFAKLTALRQPTDAASIKASLAAKSAALLAQPTDANGAIGSWAAVVNAAAARQPAPTPQPPATAVELTQRGGYIAPGLRRIPSPQPHAE